MKLLNSFACLFLLFCLPLRLLAEDPITHVEGRLQLSVEQGRLSGDFAYHYVCTDISRSSLSFFLAPDMRVLKVEGGNVKGFSFDTEARPFATLTIDFKRALEEGETMKFSLAYSGKPSQGFWTEEHHWVDIDPDFMLLPLFNNFEHFTYNVTADIDDPAYSFVDLDEGKMSRNLTVSSKSPAYYFNPILASANGKNGLKVKDVPVDGGKVSVFAQELDSAQFVGDAVVRIFDLFNHSFGKGEEVNSCAILYRPLPRPLHKVTRAFDRAIVNSYHYSNTTTLAHEIAHFWFNRGNAMTTEKWLSESFAQYAEMMFLRLDQGEEKFEEIILDLKALSAKLPPLLGGDRFSSHGDDLIYGKGPYLLYRLEEQIGREKFNEFLLNLNLKRISTTDSLLDELELLTSPDVRQAFEESLNS